MLRARARTPTAQTFGRNPFVVQASGDDTVWTVPAAPPSRPSPPATVGIPPVQAGAGSVVFAMPVCPPPEGVDSDEDARFEKAAQGTVSSVGRLRDFKCALGVCDRSAMCGAPGQ